MSSERAKQLLHIYIYTHNETAFPNAIEHIHISYTIYSRTIERFNWIMVKKTAQLSFKYSEFHANSFRIFSLVKKRTDLKHYCDPTLKILLQRLNDILWFNSPYSISIKTKIGKFFLQPIKKDSPKRLKFHKIFNRKCLTLSYSSMSNFKTIINAHNR